MTDHPPNPSASDYEGVGGPYTTADISEHVSNTRERAISVGLSDSDDPSDRLSQLVDEAREKIYDERDSIADVLQYETLDVVSEDSLIDSSFDDRAMVRAYILKMISADIGGFDSLQWHLERSPEIAAGFGFEGDKVPDRTTFSTQWWERYRHSFREHVRFEAARIAAKLKGHGFNLAEDIDDLIHEFLPSDPEDDTEIPEHLRIEQQTRDRVFKEYRELFHDVIDYGRGANKSIDAEFLTEEAEGRADWKNYEVEGDDHTKHKTTLVALESTSKAVTKKGEKRKEKETNDGRTQSTLPGTTPVDEDDDEEDDIKLESWITSFNVEARGLEPESEGPRRGQHTAFGIGQLYRKRWSIETAFRDIKQNFLANPRSRCLGVRRFFFMLCLLLYNCWVLLNLIVADEMDHRNNEEIIWRKKIFVIDLHNEVFPDIEFG